MKDYVIWIIIKDDAKGNLPTLSTFTLHKNSGYFPGGLRLLEALFMKNMFWEDNEQLPGAANKPELTYKRTKSKYVIHICGRKTCYRTETQGQHEHKGERERQDRDRDSWRTNIQIHLGWSTSSRGGRDRGPRTADGPAQRAWVKRERERGAQLGCSCAWEWNKQTEKCNDFQKVCSNLICRTMWTIL